MASNMKFGEVLRFARERAGIDLNSAARELRIRPDIINAIEESDFSHMPPRGYTRNMVNAYARYLNLNASEITSLYLGDAYAYEVGKARDDSLLRSYRTNRSVQQTPRSSRRSSRSPLRSRDEEERSLRESEGRTTALGRKVYSDSQTGRFLRIAEPQESLQRRATDRTHPSRHTALSTSQYTNFYAGPSAPSGIRSKLPLIIAVAVILVLLIIVFVLLFGRGSASDSETSVPSVPITGLTDTTGDSEASSDDDEDASTTTLVAPTSVEAGYEVVSGASPWIEVYQDSTTVFAGIVNGPAEESFEVTGTLTITTPQPGNVVVTVDGTTVELTDDDGDSMYSYTIDFAAYLEQWREENGVADDGA